MEGRTGLTTAVRPVFFLGILGVDVSADFLVDSAGSCAGVCDLIAEIAIRAPIRKRMSARRTRPLSRKSRISGSAMWHEGLT